MCGNEAKEQKSSLTWNLQMARTVLQKVVGSL